jgi:hypothetical protein
MNTNCILTIDIEARNFSEIIAKKCYEAVISTKEATR